MHDRDEKHYDLILVDSHCHLNFPELLPQIDEVIAYAAEQGVRHCLTINTRLSEASLLQDISDRFPHVFCTAGIHPHDAMNYCPDTLINELTRHAMHPKVVGLGETGLDYYYDNSPRDMQIASFDLHLQAAAHLDLPIVIHTRDADDDTCALVRKHPAAKGVFHCFSGDINLARFALDHGYYISFSGIITFKNADALRDVVRFVPLDRMLVETDSPFLAPIPYRGQSNQPGWTRVVAEHVSHIKDVSLSDVAARTTCNFFELFSKAAAYYAK